MRMNNELKKLAAKWRDEADRAEKDFARVAPMQTQSAVKALKSCAAELEEILTASDSRGSVKR